MNDQETTKADFSKLLEHGVSVRIACRVLDLATPPLPPKEIADITNRARMALQSHLQTILATGMSCAIGLFLLAVLSVDAMAAASVTLGWDAVPGAAGYRIVWGDSSGYYVQSQDAPASPAALNLPRGHWFVAVESIGGNGLASAPSNEVGVTVATIATQTTTDFLAWQTIGTADAAIADADRQRFFRSVIN